MIENEPIGGVKFCTLNLSDTIALLADWSGSGQTVSLDLFNRNLVKEAGRSSNSGARWFACVNPHSVENARRHPEVKKAIESADLVTADGTGVVVGSILLGGRVRERVCGPDIFPMLCEYLNAQKAGTRMFFLGTNDATLSALEKKFGEVYPHLELAGAFAPPYRKQFSEKEHLIMVERINASSADVLWVGLGAPKQELWCYHNAHRLNVKLIGPVGGVFDFFTGRVNLPPKWVQRFGMISLYRLCQEPRRLWRRNLDTPIFLMRVMWQLIRQGRYPST